jgi:hypothetical protein
MDDDIDNSGVEGREVRPDEVVLGGLREVVDSMKGILLYVSKMYER